MKSLIVAALFCLSCCVHAHQMSTGYLTGNVDDIGRVTADFQLRFLDLAREVTLDSNQDGVLTWGEVLANEAEITQYLQGNLTITRNTHPCAVAFGNAPKNTWRVATHYNETYLSFPIIAQCGIAGRLQIQYNGVFAKDSEHKVLVNLSHAEKNHPRVLSMDQKVIEITFENSSLMATVAEFVWQGMLHIWIGWDHILFLICLLIACVFKGEGSGKRKNTRKENQKTLWVDTVSVITAFTIAHSITLMATALNWIQLPGYWVEVGIALSVVLAAINNVFTVVTKIVWLAFGFGLLHGMGFAGVLGELGLPSDQKLLSAFAFNLGVEFGQLAIVMGLLPLLLWVKAGLQNARIKSRWVLSSGSGIIAAVAFLWVLERV